MYCFVIWYYIYSSCYNLDSKIFFWGWFFFTNWHYIPAVLVFGTTLHFHRQQKIIKASKAIPIIAQAIIIASMKSFFLSSDSCKTEEYYINCCPYWQNDFFLFNHSNSFIPPLPLLFNTKSNHLHITLQIWYMLTVRNTNILINIATV